MPRKKEYLTEREIYVLEHHSAMTYKAIGNELGITPERVRQLKVYAERKLREEKKREATAIRNQQPLTLTLLRKDIHVLIRALEAYESKLLSQLADQRRKPTDKDPDLEPTQQLTETLLQILKEKNP